MPEDLGIVQGGQPAGGTPFSSLPVDLQNETNKAAIDWANADRAYYSAREQKIGPLIGAILALGGGALAPLLGPALAGSLGIPGALGTGLVAGGTGALGGMVGGEDPGRALLGGLLAGGGSFLGSELGGLLHGGLGGIGDLFGGEAGSTLGSEAGSLAGSTAGAAGGDLANLVSPLLVSGGTSGLTTALSGLGGVLPSLSLPMGPAGFGQPIGDSGPATNDTSGNTLRPLGLPMGPDLSSFFGGAGGMPGGPGGDNTVSPLEVTAHPQTIGLGLTDPGSLIANTGGANPTGLTNPGPIDNTKPGQADPNKAIQDILKLILNNGGPLSGVIHSGPSGGPGPAGRPAGPGGPAGGPGGTNPVGPVSGIPGGPGGPGGTGGPAPGLINGAGPGGSGVGLGGPGQADVRGSTAPDIYPWVGQGQGGGL